MQQRSRSLYILSAFFGLYVLFLYGPTITIGVLSFQGPGGGLTFPMRVAARLCAGPMVIATTVVVSVMGGLLFDRAGRQADLFANRADDALGNIWFWRATDMDDAFLPVNHVCRLQTVRQKL